MLNQAESSALLSPPPDLTKAVEELTSGDVANGLEMFARANTAPTADQLRVAADRSLASGKIPLALRLYRKAKVAPDPARLSSAAAAERKHGKIYPEIYDFLIESLSWQQQP